jgi:glutaminyl-tRNA synthetase
VVRAKVEPSLTAARYHADRLAGDAFQFERTGYFCVDRESAPSFGGAGPAAEQGGGLVFNRSVSLKDGWGKMASKD